MKTRRDKVAPQALLAPRRESLANLADRVMTLIYGPHAETALMQRLMHQPATSNPSDYSVGDDAEVVALVKSQIICALAAGQILLAVELDLSSFDKNVDDHLDSYKLLYGNHYSKSDWETEWLLIPDFWSEPNAADAISWSESIVHVPVSFIYEGPSASAEKLVYRQTRPLSRYYTNLPSRIPAKAFVANPDAALRHFFEFGPLPSEQQADEYQSSIANLVKEATAAAWRYLALTKIGKDFNQREVFRQMVSYLKSRGLYDEENDRPSQGVLLAVASKMHKQFQMDPEVVATQPVYVSSTPPSATAAAAPKRQIGRKRRPSSKAPKF